MSVRAGPLPPSPPPLPIPIECAPLKGWGGWLVGRWVGSDRMGRGERREVVVGGGGGARERQGGLGGSERERG